MRVLSKNSRYNSTPLVTDDKNVTRFIEWKPPLYGEIPEFIYTVDARDMDRPGFISHRLFGTVQLWWLILHYNKITDPYTLEVGQKLRIPSVEVIKRRIDSRSRVPQLFTDIAINEGNYKVNKTIRRKVLPFKSPPASSSATSSTTTLFLFNFAFPVPDNLSGTTHFQLQISDTGNFSNVLASLMTQTSVERWFYYDPSASNGAGAFRAFPTAGINGSAYASQTVYYKVSESDLAGAEASEYYFRYRTWVNNIEGSWFVSPPLILS